MAHYTQGVFGELGNPTERAESLGLLTETVFLASFMTRSLGPLS